MVHLDRYRKPALPRRERFADGACPARIGLASRRIPGSLCPRRGNFCSRKRATHGAGTSTTLLIRNARIVDGTGAPHRDGSVAVRDGKIVAVGDVPAGTLPAGTREIDAKGQVVAPGFIDVHTHFDPQICWDRLATPCIEHGVTTILMGNCSLSLAPVKKEDQRALAGMFGRSRTSRSRPSRKACPGRETYPEYLDFIRTDLGINVANLVGHSALRSYVMGAAAQERRRDAGGDRTHVQRPAGRRACRRRRAVDVVRRHGREHEAGARPLLRRATRSSRSFRR